jgi:hypothetical protein
MATILCEDLTNATTTNLTRMHVYPFLKKSSCWRETDERDSFNLSNVEKNIITPCVNIADGVKDDDLEDKASGNISNTIANIDVNSPGMKSSNDGKKGTTDRIMNYAEFKFNIPVPEEHLDEELKELLKDEGEDSMTIIKHVTIILKNGEKVVDISQRKNNKITAEVNVKKIRLFKKDF